MKPKICFIVSSPITATSFLDNHFTVLSNKFELILITNLNDSGTINYENKFLSEIKHIPIKRKISLLQDIKCLFMMFFYLRSKDVSVVITFTPKASLLGILSAFLARINFRILFFTGQVWHTKKGFIKSFLIFLDKVVVFFSTNVIVDGYSQKTFLINNNIIKDNNSDVIGKGTISGVDIDKFKPDLVTRLNFRKKLNISNDDVVFLFLGRLNKDKGIYDLLDAFSLLNKENVKLLIVGPDEENIYDNIKLKYDLKNIILYGPTFESQNLLQLCDIFCLPSHREAFGLSIIEASSCEKAVLCSDTYGLQYTIIDNITGLRHITHDVNSIHEKMKLLSEDANLRLYLGTNGRQYVKDNFSTSLLTKLWEDYFTKLLLI